MEIRIQNISKSFGNNSVFKNISLNIHTGQSLAVIGANGSGKSTFIKMIAGLLMPDSGIISWIIDGNTVDVRHVGTLMAVAAPYSALIEEFTFPEMLRFHSKFKKTQEDLSIEDIIAISGLSEHTMLPISFFSSGMKQKAKLTLALCFESQALLLDEPCNNLDINTTKWYNDTLSRFINKRLLVVCAHSKNTETELCKTFINTTDFND